MSRLSLAAGLALGLLAAPAPAQTPKPADLPPGLPSPLELVRGLREQGSPDLAIEYLADLEKNPPKTLAPEDKQIIPLERAKCLLEAADEEPDEAVRADRIAEAKAAFEAFRKAHPSHPRAAEASLALARLTAMEARAELGKALRTEVGKDDDAGKQRQKAAAAATRPKFLAAAANFGAAAAQIRAQLEKGDTDPKTKQALERERFEAALAKGINQYNLADTYVHPDARETIDRQKYIEEAKKTFEELKKAPDTNRAHWVALAWLSESDYAIQKTSDARATIKAVEAAKPPAAAEGKRLVGFFELRRAYLGARGERTVAAYQAAEKQIRAWLAVPGNNPRRPTPESMAANFYLAMLLKDQAENALAKVRANPVTGLYPMSGTTRAQLDQAEKIFRQLATTENDYTARAVQNRMRVVRLMVGEATKLPADYANFELCSMASLVQMVKLTDLDTMLGSDAVPAAAAGLGGLSAADPTHAAARKAHLERIIALLERARALATDKDPPADVADVVIRLIYFYNQADQPFEAAVLGDHAAHTLSRAGHAKAAAAGAMAVGGYLAAAASLKPGGGLDEAAAEEAKKADRERAVRLARFLDERYPTDPATDGARHRLGLLLYEENRLAEAFDTLVKIRAGYQRVAPARLLEGAVAQQLLAANDKSALPDGKRPEVFRRVVADLDKLPKPGAGAGLADVREYVNARCRLAQLYLIQYRVDPAAEKAAPGAVKAADLARDTLELVTKEPPVYPCLYKDGGKELNENGLELKFLAEDARTRAAYLRARQLLDAAKDPAGVTAALNVMQPVLAEMEAGPLNNDALKKWAEEGAEDEAAATFKGRVVALADGVDRLRQAIVIQALKARVKQNQVDDALRLIDLLKRYGGSIEKNVAVFQQLTAEMAGQILTLRREKKDAEAKTLTDGFSRLLNRLSAEPNLPPSVQLFLGNSLITVGEDAKAIEVLDRVPKPAPAKLAPEAYDGLPEPEQKQVQNYRLAALYLLRALRQTTPPNLARAEGLLKEAMGDEKKPGFGARILDFHREVALLHEAKGAAAPDLRAANTEYGLAVKKWNELARGAQIRWERAREQVDKPDSKVQGGDLIRYRGAFLDAFFDVQRCLYVANKKILGSKPDRFQKTVDDVAKRFVTIETSHPHNEIGPEVRARYHDFLEEQPQLKAAYTAAGGKFFLTRE